MPLPTFIVIPDDMGSNILEGSTVPGSLPADVNHWVAAIHRGTGFNDYIYPNAAVGADAPTAAVNNSDEYVTTPRYVNQVIAAAIAAIPPGADVRVQSFTYNSGTRVLRIEQTNGSSWDINLPVGTSTIAGLLKTLTAAQIAGANTDDTNAATPMLVAAMIAAAIAGLPAAFDTKVSGFNYNSTSRTLQIADNNGGLFNVVMPIADNVLYGLTKLAIASMYPAFQASDTLSATPAFVNAAIAAAVATLPGDKFLQGLQSYNATTNTMTLLMSDGSTVAVDMTTLLNDAIATVPNKHVAASAASSDSSVVVSASGVDNQTFDITTNAGIIPIADAGGNFVATNVEDALAELANAAPPASTTITSADGSIDVAAVAGGYDISVDASDIPISDTGGNFNATNVEGALAELTNDRSATFSDSGTQSIAGTADVTVGLNTSGSSTLPAGALSLNTGTGVITVMTPGNGLRVQITARSRVNGGGSGGYAVRRLIRINGAAVTTNETGGLNEVPHNQNTVEFTSRTITLNTGDKIDFTHRNYSVNGIALVTSIALLTVRQI